MWLYICSITKGQRRCYIWKRRKYNAFSRLSKKTRELFGIFTSPENINKVKKWMNESKYNPDLVYTFEEFLEITKEKSKEVDKKNEFKKIVKDTKIEDNSY